MTGKGKILFVDDEKRVLNSMRGLFRRDYELFLTTDGAEAVQLVAEHDIDVIVADQRMPGLSGVEVLGKIREMSPRTVRILLTGYADPEAIEGSINIGEVFRFLSKPCPPKLLRETLKLGVDASRVAAAVQQPLPPPVRQIPATPTRDIHADAAVQALPPTQEKPVLPDEPAAPTTGFASSVAQFPEAPPPTKEVLPGKETPSAAADSPAVQSLEMDEATMPIFNEAPTTTPAAEPASPASHWNKHTEIVLSGDSSQEVEQLDVANTIEAKMNDVGVAVFTVNAQFAESAMRAIAVDRNAMLATTLVKVAEVLEQREAGVLVTDFTSDIGLLQNMIGTLKHHLPELVTIVVSENRDATDMINLINYGQVFRYVEKPIEAEMLRNDVNAAVLKHLQLVEHPELIQRHQVVSFRQPTGGSATLNQFIGKVTRLRGRWSNSYDSSH